MGLREDIDKLREDIDKSIKRDERNAVITAILIGFVFVAIIAISVITIIHIDNKRWNNGYCECGGNWTYEEAVGHRNTTDYIYVCDKCGKRMNFEVLR